MSRPTIGAVSILVALVAMIFGCGHRLQRIVTPDHPTTIRFDAPRVIENGPSGRTYVVSWVADGGNGSIAAYACALDPASPDQVDASWDRVTARERTLKLDRSNTPRQGFHLFVVRAIDDRGQLSPPNSIALAADNVPPLVQIDCPVISPTTTNLVSPTVTIKWTGDDPDGVITHRPVSYKYLLMGPGSEYPIDAALADPDAFRDYYANHPSGPWTGWSSTSGESTATTYTNLVVGVSYLFAVIAFDEQGAYSPVFSRGTNMLYMSVVQTAIASPRISMFAPGLDYTYPSGGFTDDVAHHIPVEVSSSLQVTVTWSATSVAGSCGVRYRWVLDPSSLDDPTPRSDPSDVTHWSNWSDVVTTATVGPLGAPAPPKRSVHSLYIEAMDVGGTSLGIVDLVTVPPTFSKDLLIVDDTRMRPDQFQPNGDLYPFQGAWPNAAELDTFLYARGGFPWQFYPPGTLSTPGLFAGYEFDTLGTRWGSNTFVPLAVLSQYRYVIWYVDLASATFANPPNVPNDPITALRSLSSPGVRNLLATYVTMGGHLWLAGSGVAYANLIAYNDASNDLGGGSYVFDSASPRRELVRGRFMYDGPLWQSSIRVRNGLLATPMTRYTGRLEGSGSYPTLPATLSARTPATDPLPPLRTAPQFYPTSINIAYLNQPNVILSGGASALDTLMIASSLVSPPSYAVTMTCAPPGDPHVVCSGFDFWWFQRAQDVQLVDFVLHDLWGFTRQPAMTATARR
jgi:hypothetical protein